MTNPVQGGRSPAESLDRAAAILERYGRHEDAALARHRFSDTSRARTVVVLGEIKRGKSSLVNALLGRRDLVPVDVDLCSGLPVRVHASAGPGDGPTGADRAGVHDLTVHHPTEDRPAPIDQLHRWARYDSGAVAEGDEPPTGISVAVSDSPLGDVVLVDTPGAGGLDDSAVRMALAEAGDAGVLVMVCDASTPITAGEMEILGQAQATVGHVVVAVTKTDKNLRRWRDIVADDRRLIEQHLGLRPPVIGVSSLRAVDAVELAPDRRGHVERVSGIAALRAAVADGLGYGDDLPRLAGLRAARSALAGVADAVSEDLRVAREADTILPELEERRAELDALRSHSQQWEQYLARNLSLARTQLATDLDRDLDAIKERWTATVNASGMRVLRSRPQIFTAQIESELSGVMDRATGAMLRVLEAETARLFPTDPSVWSAVAQPTLAAVLPPEVTSAAVGRKTDNLFDPTLVTMGMIGAGLLTAVIPLAPVAGGVWVGVNLAYRAMKNGKTALLQWLRETISATRVSTNRIVDTISTTARPEIIVRYRDHLRRESEAVQERIDDAKRTARQSAAEREQDIARLTKNEKILRATLAELDTHLAALEARR